MKFAFVAASLLATLAVGAAAQQPKATAPAAGAPPALKTDRERASYGLGLRLGRSLRQQSVDVDPAALVRGFHDGLAGGEALLTDEQIAQAMEAFEEAVMAKRAEVAKAAAAKNKALGDAFLAANGKKEGVQTLPSGLQYKVLKEGTGPMPKETDTVTTHYRGTLIDGTEFDSSYKRNEPATFGVNQVIKGWTEALQRMKVGSKWQLFIPAELAYGADQRPGSPIPPNSTLIFEVELLGIEPQQ